MSAYTEVFPGVPLSGCYFHLGHLIYKRVQGDALKEQCRDPLDRTVKRYTHMLLAVAFVPEADVLTSFTELRRECPGELHGVYDEFKEFFTRYWKASKRLSTICKAHIYNIIMEPVRNSY